MKKTLQLISKVIFLLFISYFLLPTSSAQSPDKMSYQAVIRDGSSLVTNHAVGMRISILHGSSSGSSVYTETQTQSTNANGLVTIEIGTGTTTDNFSTINWSSGPYFIKTETDPTGGTNYIAIVGTSQLLSVPYALHAKTVASYPETDPIFAVWNKSTGINITASQVSDFTTSVTNNAAVSANTAKNSYPTADATKLAAITGTNTGDETAATIKTKLSISNLSGSNTGDQDISGIATNATAITALQTEQTTQNSAIALNTAKVGLTPGTSPGQMLYWNGTAWVVIAATVNEAATLQMISGVPTWVGGTSPPPSVTNPTTGKTWMDRNLGATQVATSSTDAASYGDLYQWGRGTDGHQIRTSATTSSLSGTDVPGNANFILAPGSPLDWRSPQNDNLWQGVNGANNPCPAGYRIPTETELDAERASWSSQNPVGAYASPLKFPAAGYRHCTDGLLDVVGSYGLYWSSTVDGADSRFLNFYPGNAFMWSDNRASGHSVRCIKD